MADDGLQFLDVLHQFTPDVLVIEPELLWGGGDGVVAVLRENPETQSVPVLVLTTDINRSAVYRISQFPVGDYLTQPVTSVRLTESVSRLASGIPEPPRTELHGRAAGGPLSCSGVGHSGSRREPTHL